MANWIKSNIVLTDIGRTLLAYAQIGNGKIEITRVVARETFETVNAPARMRSYVLSDIPNSTIEQEGILLEALVGVAHPDPENSSVETSLLTVRFSNDDLDNIEKSYNLRQIIVMARLIEYDNDLGEVPYMVAQCAEFDNPDYIPPRKDNPTSMDYDLYVIHSGVPEITISLRTSGYVFNDTYNREVTKIWNSINDIKNNEVGQHTDSKEFKIWKPVYSESRQWSKVFTGETLTGSKSAERFNQYGENDDGTYSDNVATGDCSHAEGAFNEVLAPNSHVEGINNYISADSDAVSANGVCNSVFKGKYGTVHGRYNAVGENDETASVGFGVIGTCNILHNSDNAFISGNYNTLSNANDSFISGTSNTLGSGQSFVTGNFNIVNVTDNINTKYGMIVSGIKNTISDSGCTVVIGGQNTVSQTDNSILIGTNNESDSTLNSLIAGYNNKVSGHNNIVFGHDNIVSGHDCIVSGVFSVEDTDSNYAVIIGGGTSDSDRRNIMTLDKNGNLHINNLYVNDIKNNDGTDKITVSRSDFEALVNRVTALETRLAELQ